MSQDRASQPAGDRYHRQSLVAEFGEAGTARLRQTRVLLVGVGALGCAIADQLVRAGVGSIRLVDRDVVDVTNLQRQTLYDEADARRGLAKVEAAANRLRAINSDVKLDPRAIDVEPANIESLLKDVDLILDGSDNAELRYLVNDAAVKHRLPWVMGGAIGVEGRVAAFKPGGACLRCVFPTPPSPGELATCDTAGVLAPAIHLAASLQVIESLKLITHHPSAALTMFVFDLWMARVHAMDLTDARRADCPCCGGSFEFLNNVRASGAKLCGKNAVQVRGPAGQRIDLKQLASRLASVATLDASGLMLRVQLHERPELQMNIFGDGRMIVFGTTDLPAARAIYARVVGV